MFLSNGNDRLRKRASKRIPSSREQFENYRQKSNGSTTSSSAQHRPARSSSLLLVSFLRMLRGWYGQVLWSLVALILATLLGLVPPAATKFIVDNVLTGAPLPEYVPQWVPREPSRLLIAITAAVLIVSAIKIGVQLVGRWNARRISKLVKLAVNKQVFQHVIRLPLHRVQELKSGGAMSILRKDASSVNELMTILLYDPLQALVQLFGSLCILAWVDWRMLLGALVMIPLVWLTHHTWIRRLRPQHRQVRALREEIDALTTELFGGIRVVRAFSRQRSETSRIMRAENLMARKELYAWWWARGVEIVWESIIPLCSALLLIYGGWRVLAGALTLGDMMMFVVYLLMLLVPLSLLAQSATRLQDSLAGFDRVLDLLEEPIEMESGSRVEVSKAHVAGRISFEMVSFSYPGSDLLALDGINLTVEAGETIALVGPSGSGKTTLCNLAMRFYDPTEGRVLLDNRDLREIKVESYRKLLSIVDQDVFLFDGTIASNIAYGDQHATEYDIRRAAELANVDEFIADFPAGYNTVIGERGVKLSGGQRQRIATARAILADPKILILDEASSNMDTETERAIQANLAELMQKRTCFVIAHRLSTIAHASRIVVLEAGRITEIGTHEELLNASSWYREMAMMQTASVPLPTC